MMYGVMVHIMLEYGDEQMMQIMLQQKIQTDYIGMMDETGL